MVTILTSVLTSLFISLAGTAAIVTLLWSLVDFISGIALYLSLFITDMTSEYLSSTLNGNLFMVLKDTLAIPPELNINTMISAIAFSILFVLLFVNVMRSMTAEFTGEKVASPFQILARGVMVALIIYILFNHKIDMYGESYTGMLQAIGGMFSGFIEDLSSKLKLSVSLSSLSSGVVDTEFLDVKAKILGLFMSITLFSSVVMAAITFIERIFSFGLYLLLGPIFIAFYVADETADTAKQWFVGIFAQLFAIMVSLLCWYMFIVTFVNMIGFSMNDLEQVALKLQEAGINPKSDIDLSSIAVNSAQNVQTQQDLLSSVCTPDPITGQYEPYCVESFNELNTQKETVNVLSKYMEDFLADRKKLSDFEQITQLLVCVVFLNLCKNSEKIFNAVGFRTMPNQDSARAMVAGMGTGMMVSMQLARFGVQGLSSTGRAISSGISKGKAEYSSMGRQDKAMAVNNLQERMASNKMEIANLNSQKTGLQTQLGNQRTAVSNSQRTMENAQREVTSANQAYNNALNKMMQDVINGRTNTPQGVKHSSGQRMETERGIQGNVFATASTVGKTANGRYVTGNYSTVFANKGDMLQRGDKVLGSGGAEFIATGKGWTDEKGNSYSVVNPVSDKAKEISQNEMASIEAFDNNDMNNLRDRLAESPEMMEHQASVVNAENNYTTAKGDYEAKLQDYEAIQNNIADVDSKISDLNEKNINYEEQFNRIQGITPDDFRDAGIEGKDLREQIDNRKNPYVTSEMLGLTPDDHKQKTVAQSLRDYFKKD